MGKNVSLLGYQETRAQLLTHYIIDYNGLYREHRAMFRCPHCNVSSILNNSSITFDYYCNRDTNVVFISSIISCLNIECQKETVIIEHFSVKDLNTDSLYDFIKQNGCIEKINQESVETVVVYPAGDYISVIDYGDNNKFIPKPIQCDFVEIQKISSVSTRATLVLARRLLEKIILEKYPILKTAKTLENMIENIPDASLSKDIMDDIRIIGNKAVHVSDPSNELAITNEDAALAIHVLDDLLHEFYINPGKKKIRRENLADLRERVKQG